MNQAEEFENETSFTFPKTFLVIVLTVCFTPTCLNIFGYDFSSTIHDFDTQEFLGQQWLNIDSVDEMFYALTGSLHHGLLEWSAVVIAMLTIVLAFSHFAITKDITMPIIGLALFCSGIMDAFHTMAAMRLIEAVAENTNLIPFTWALARGFNAAILLTGVLLSLNLKTTNFRISIYHVCIIGVASTALSYLLIDYAANSEQLPQTQFTDAFITRPYDVAPLILFIITIPFFWKLYRKKPNLLTASLLISIIPEIMLEIHMAFGSSTLFDNHFNIAHFLKVIAYLVPFIGLVLDYMRTYRVQYHTQALLEKREHNLVQANAELEEFAYRTSHDLRSPIVSSIGLLDLAEKSIQSNDQDKAIKSIAHTQKSLKKLEVLIKDILVLTEVEKKDEENQLCDVSEIVNEALEKMAHIEKFDRLDIQTDYQENHTLYTKKTRFNMILENLISNAIKYQDDSKSNSYIKITTRKTNTHFMLEVKDNGLGIPPDQQDKLFTMFSRFHPKVSFGSGLGLYLMKKSADVINAEIFYESHNEGSIFRLHIPLL